MNETQVIPESWTQFLSVDYPLESPFDFVDISPIEVFDNWLFYTSPYDTFDIEHDGTDDGVVDAMEETFGVVLKMRPDLGPLIWEIVEGL